MKCGTCRKAKKLFDDKAIPFKFIDITETPPSEINLRKIVNQANIELIKIFNTSGIQYRELKIKDRLPAMTEKEIIRLLAANGRLIKRPIVTNGEITTIGFKLDEFCEKWGC